MALLTNSVCNKQGGFLQVPCFCLALTVWISVVVHTAHAEKPPEFVTEPESSVVKLETSATLTCTVDPPDSEISWLFNKEVVDSARLGIAINGGNLRIQSFSASKNPQEVSHIGRYQCVASNSLGTVVSREAVLDKASLRHFDDGLQDMYINATKGNVAVIPCQPPRANPPAHTRFEVDGAPVDHEAKQRHRLLPSGSLQIADVRESDQGAYRCVAYNPVSGKERTAPNLVHLSVTSPVIRGMPQFITKPQNTQVIQGQNLTLECLVEGSPVPIVTWDKYGGDLPIDRHAQILGNLIIYDVRMVDQGTYICQMTNSVGPLRTAIASVEVLERPSVRISPPSKDVSEGGRVTFYCHTRGYLRMQGEWLHNGQHLEQNEFITITDTELTIDKVKESDAGIYQCVGRNKDESAYASAWLRVTKDAEMSDSAARGAFSHLLNVTHPTNLSAVIGDNVTLTCPLTPEVTTSGVTWFKDTDLVPRSSPVLEIIETQIQDSGEYTCNVTQGDSFLVATATLTVNEVKDPDDTTTTRTTVSDPPKNNVRPTTVPPRRTRPRDGTDGNNNRGRGGQDSEEDEDLDPSNPANDDQMVPPSRPEVRKLSDQSVMLIWSVPENNGLEITFFKVQYRQFNSGTRKGWVTLEEDIDKDTTMHEVSGLTPGDYKFRVVAVFSNNDNKQGPSRRFTLSRGRSPNHNPPLGIPMIVVIDRLSSTVLSVQWQYDIHDTPIEGFFIYHKPYHSRSDYQRATHLKPDSREYIVNSLQPNTEYSFKIQSFNTAGESEFSYPVVQKTLPAGNDEPDSGLPEPPGPTLSASGGPEPGPGFEFPRGRSIVLPILTTTKKPSTDDGDKYPPPRPQSSNDTLYMVLGIVLGAMLLLLLVFMVMCWFKQRQQRRLMATMDERNKFHDPSRVIYNDSLRKKPHMNGGGHFLLNGINGTNGRVTNGHVPRQHANGNMNINVNPITDLDAESKEQYSLQELRSSLQEVLQQPPPPPPNGGVMDSNCNSMHRSCHSPHDNFYEEVDNMECCDCDHHHHHHHHHQHCQDGCHGNHCDSGPYYAPPDYNSFSSFNKSRIPPPNSSSHDPLLNSDRSQEGRAVPPPAAARTTSPDHIPRSFERPYRSHDRSHDRGHGSNEYPSEQSLSSSSYTSGHKKRRRRDSGDDSGSCLRDQATNTDISSNEDTLDSRHRHNNGPSLPYTPRENQLPENDGGREGHDLDDLEGHDPCDSPDSYYPHLNHDSHGDIPPMHSSTYADYGGDSPPCEMSPCLGEPDNGGSFPDDLPRANDYSASENEEDEEEEEDGEEEAHEHNVFLQR